MDASGIGKQGVEEAVAALAARGVTTEPVHPQGDAGRKAIVRDPDGNPIAIIEVTSGE